MKKGAPTGNNNAKKENPSSSQVQFRATHLEKSKWVESAQKQGLTLSEWIKNKLNQVD